jgi:diacylglycerol kinase family enzyme
MRALLVVNPYATTTRPSDRDHATEVLKEVFEIEVAHTRRREHAISLAREAALDGVEAVIALGGDGTLNEVVNGLLSAEAEEATPALGVIPGGATNVFARALGIPTRTREAAARAAEAGREKRYREVTLGRLNGRWFTFCAGLGIDAEVIHRVEQARRQGSKASPGLYLRSAVQQCLWGTDRSTPGFTLASPGQEPVPLFAAMIQNTVPWTYLGPHSVNLCPEASFEEGLELMGVRSLSLATSFRTAWRMLAPYTVPGGDQIYRLHNAREVTFQMQRPVAVQVDGDYCGEVERATLSVSPRGLRVLVP